jgi:hypothetical protein
MTLHAVGRGVIGLLVLAGTGAPPVHAQDLEVKLHGGIVQPLASTGDYFQIGPSVGVDVGVPMSDALNVMLDLEWDWLQTTDIYPTPTTNRWQYRIGLEADLGGSEDGLQVRGLAAVGGSTFRSHEFWLASRRPYTFEGETINQTSLVATGGVRVGLLTDSDGIQWWLTGKLNWTPIKDVNQDALQELASNELDPLGSALSAALQIGVTLW